MKYQIRYEKRKQAEEESSLQVWGPSYERGGYFVSDELCEKLEKALKPSIKFKKYAGLT